MQHAYQDRAARPGRAASLATLAILVVAAFVMLSHLLARFDTFGFHDWDVHAAYRHVTTVSLLEHRQLPGWHPWLCGGFPAFGHPEGATNLVSPYLPLYLLADVRVALRLEVLGATLTGLLGAYLLARRFSSSPALCGFVAVVSFLNGRWALQAAVGHTWHLQYAWIPWVLLLFDRAAASGRLRDAVGAGGLLALMVYMGGIYPVPHAALLLVVYASVLCLARRSARPGIALGVAGASALGLSAPKLAAVYETLARVPRPTEAAEVTPVGALLAMMTDRSQHMVLPPVAMPAFGWHEWGIYIGWPAILALIVGGLLARGPRERALQVCALLLLLLGLGAFHPWSPWALLHGVPPFSSQHVPSRFLFPMVLVAALLVASSGEALLRRFTGRRGRLEVVLLLALALLALDTALVARRSFATAFRMEPSSKIVPAEQFEHRRRPLVHYRVRDFAPPYLLSMMANQGLLACYGVPDALRVAALGVEDPDYRGMAWVAGGQGTAELRAWSPNRVLVRYRDAQPGALLVYNMNFDPGWRAAGQPAVEHEGKVAARLAHADGELELRYRPRTLPYALWAPALTLAAVAAGAGLRARRMRP